MKHKSYRDYNHRYAHTYVAEYLEYHPTIPDTQYAMWVCYTTRHNMIFKLR